jgi:putative inorganic carbon (hco3(-)) transporter
LQTREALFLNKKNIILLYVICLLNILGLVFFLVTKKGYFFAYCLLPVAVLIVFLALFKMDTLVKGVIFFTPLSISLADLGFLDEGLDLSIPTEPILAGIMLIFIFHELHSGMMERKFWKHPITILLLCQLSWTMITTLTSQMPMVSVKFFVAKLWFIVTAYVLCTQMFRQRKNIFLFPWLYIIPFCLVIVYTIIGHNANGLTEDAADWVVRPFYNDHTSYGAMLALFIPFIVGFIFLQGIAAHIRLLIVMVLGLFVLALILSYTRAAWVSIFAAAAIGVTLFLRIRFNILISVFVIFLGIFLLFQNEIMISLSSNRTDSTGDLSKNVESISNISTDASNVERINRWNSALRMFNQHPVFGFGPGTYMFQYAPYQKSSERTIISTNAGTAGNAHSEYLGPLSEQGILGLVFMGGLLFVVFRTGYKVVYKVTDWNLKIITVCSVLGLTTYFLHGFLNNFLDTDKAAIPFYGMIAILVAVDCFYEGHEKKEESLPEISV